MGKVLYDFIPASTITPYIGAGAGVAFVDSNSLAGNTQCSPTRASSAWASNIDSQWRVALEGRYVGTTNPSVTINGVNVSR